MTESTPAAFDGVVIVYNHRPETALLAEQCQEELQDQLSVPVRTLQTVADGREPNAEILDKELRAGDAVAVIGGEGTYRDTAGALLLPHMEEVSKSVAITSLNQRGKGCNACDIGKSLHGTLTRPSHIFSSRLRAVTGFALEATVAQPGGEVATGLAMSYIGLGHSADESAYINTDAYKNANPVVRDVGVVGRTLLSKSEFAITYRGREQVLGELSFNKGEWMAKHGRFPVRHWDERFRVTPVRVGRLHTAEAMTGLLFGAAKGYDYTGPLSFSTISPVGLHVDGEPPVAIPPVSTITVGLAPRGYTMLTTKLLHTA